MPIKATGVITINDSNEIIVSNTEPTAMQQDRLWLDTSITPNILKKYSGAEWSMVNDPSIPVPPTFTQVGIPTFANIVKGTFSGNTFTRDSGIAWDAGFTSVETFTNGWYMEYTISSLSSSIMIGFNHGTNDNGYTNIDFAVYQASNQLTVYENGSSKGVIFAGVAVGNVIRVIIYNNKIYVARGVTLLYTSATTPTLPMYIDATVSKSGGEIQNIVYGTYEPPNAIYLSEAANNRATDAYYNASTANNSIGQIFSDAYITPDEKQSLKREWDNIVSEYTINVNNATTYVVDSTAYTTAYNTLNTFLNVTNTVFTSMTSTTTANSATARTNFAAYYNARSLLLDAIQLKIQNGIDSKSTKAEYIITTTKFSDYDKSISEIKSVVGEMSSINTDEGETLVSKLTAISQTVNGIDFDFIATARNSLDSLTGETNTINTTLENYIKYIRFENGKIILGEQGAPLRLEIDNDDISFYANGVSTPLATFKDNKLEVLDITAYNSLTIGAYTFTPRANGGLSFYRKG